MYIENKFVLKTERFVCLFWCGIRHNHGNTHENTLSLNIKYLSYQSLPLYIHKGWLIKIDISSWYYIVITFFVTLSHDGCVISNFFVDIGHMIESKNVLLWSNWNFQSFCHVTYKLLEKSFEYG